MSSQSESLNHPSHPHPLYLTIIHNSGLRHDCNACRQQICSGFSYRCERCNFDLHTTCASKLLSQIHMQSYQSTPTANLMYRAAAVTQPFPTAPTPRTGPPFVYYNYQAGPVNHGHGIVRPSGRGSGRGNNSVMNQAIPGLINGAAQTLGTYGVQASLGVGAFAGTNWGGGWNANGGNGGGGSGDWVGDGGQFNDGGGNGGGSGDWGGDGGPSSDYGGNEASSF